MPKRSRSAPARRRRYRRRTYKKKRKYSRRFPRVQRISATRFPQSAIVKHVYCCDGTLAVSQNSPNKALHFHANGMYDPEDALGGHQPLLFDELSARFNHYTVLGAKISIRFYKDEKTNDDMDPTYLTIQCQDAPHQHPTIRTGQNLVEYREMPGVKWATMYKNQQMVTLSSTYSASKFHGKSKHNIAGEAELRGDIAHNPTERACFSIYASDKETNEGETDSVAALHWECRIVYTAKWTEPKPLTAS